MLYGPKLKASGPRCGSSAENALGGGLADLTAAAVSCVHKQCGVGSLRGEGDLGAGRIAP